VAQDVLDVVRDRKRLTGVNGDVMLKVMSPAADQG